VHKVAEKPLAAGAGSADRLEDLVLVRIASAPGGVDRGEIAADLALLAGPQMPASRWRAAVERAIEVQLTAGRIAPQTGGFVATKAGAAVAAKFLGVTAGAALVWEQACNVWLIAKALGLRKTSAKRLAQLATAEGLRAAILVQAYRLNFKGEVTPARLRHALAAAALERAFGGRSATALADQLGLSARASRLLAAQLMDKPRDPGTDRRLVAALAAQACGAASADLSALRAAVLRRAFVVPEQGPPRQPDRKITAPAPANPAPAADKQAQPETQLPPTRTTPAPDRPLGLRDVAREVRRLATTLRDHPRPHRQDGNPAPPAGLPAAGPLDLPGFASEVRRCAAGEAQGWSGDRKAYISRVWRSLRTQRPDWGLSEIEFKCMLAEAHRAGQLALANADLKDESNIKDVQDSAVIYKNAVFHFIRVDA
jgi:hypothetical protein